MDHDGTERARRRRPDIGRLSTWRPFAEERGDRDGGPPRTAFVLSGGGNQGVAQVGMLRAVLERGIEPDVVIGRQPVRSTVRPWPTRNLTGVVTRLRDVADVGRRFPGPA
jgi:hypothetical protein